MLFDLQGKRRRVVQVTYLTLAVLMGGGLVFFGIGSDVQGGLADFFTGGDSAEQGGSQVLEDQLAEAQGELDANPDDPQALADVVQANVQLATTTDPAARSQGQLFTEEGTPRLEAADESWQRYLELEKQPDDALAFLMTQVYGPQGLNDPGSATDAAGVVADERRTPEAYLVLAQYATLAGDERQAELAGKRATDLAPASDRAQIAKQVKAIQAAAKAASAQAQAEPAPGGATDTGARP